MKASEKENWKSWLINKTTSWQKLSQLEEVPKGGTKAIGEWTRGKFFGGITTCPHCADPMESPNRFSFPTKKVFQTLVSKFSFVSCFAILSLIKISTPYTYCCIFYFEGDINCKTWHIFFGGINNLSGFMITI